MKLNVGLGSKLSSIFSRNKQDIQQLLEEIEETLICADFGVEFTGDILQELNKTGPTSDKQKLLHELKSIIRDKMALKSPPVVQDGLTAYLIFGVNGTGKTTSSAKLAYRLKNQGRKVLIAAADTHRDAAIDQLVIWAERAGVPVVKQYQGSDPGAVVYDACDASMSRNIQCLIIDTAGRLHNKQRLMEELAKIRRILDKKLPRARRLKLLTVDATTGQNAISQAATFHQYVGIDGIILTKLDSSAKGGIACTVSGKLNIPILFVGNGEAISDLVEFDPDRYTNLLFS
ncbi:MAG: signal recognition particle-docking protein FtsY [Spirochaetota bacterium]